MSSRAVTDYAGLRVTQNDNAMCHFLGTYNCIQETYIRATLTNSTFFLKIFRDYKETMNSKIS